MAVAETNRRIHAQVVVRIARRHKFDGSLPPGIGAALDQYCDEIRNGEEELSDEDVEAIRFLTAVRTEVNAAPDGGPSSGGDD